MNGILLYAMYVVNTVCSVALLWTAVCATNHMDKHSRWQIRIAFILLGTGAFAAFIAPLFLPRYPTWPELFLLTGITALVYSDRRRRFKVMEQVRSDAEHPSRS